MQDTKSCQKVLGGTQTRQEGYNFVVVLLSVQGTNILQPLYMKFPNATQTKQEKFNHYSNDVVSQNG